MALLLASCATTAIDRDAAVREITQLEGQYVDAWKNLDEALIERTTAPDARWINNAGSIANKEESLALYRSGRIHLDTSQETDLEVRVYGNTAIVTGVWNISGTTSGEERSGRMRFTRVWVRRNGQWLMASWQGTSY